MSSPFRPPVFRPPVIAALLLSCASFAGYADQNDPRLDDLFAELRQTRGSAMQARIESAIWRLWVDAGDEQTNRWLRDGTEAMHNRDFDRALALFDRVIERRPDFAEGWNKRATLYYLQDELVASMRDVRQTLKLEPRHFGALSGMGLIFLQRGDLQGALDAFQEVLSINPHSASAKANIEQLRKRLREEVI